MVRRAVALALATAVSLAVPAVAAAPKKVTRNGVGRVKLGSPHAKLRAAGLVGPVVKGCELGDPRERAALLKDGVEGAAQLTRSKPRRVRSIVVTDGAAAKGVGIGAKRREVEQRFPHADVDESTEEVFGITLVTIPKRDGGRFQFGVEVETGKVSVIGVPRIVFCE